MSSRIASTTARDVAERNLVTAAAALPLWDWITCTQLWLPSPPQKLWSAFSATAWRGPGSRSTSPAMPYSWMALRKELITWMISLVSTPTMPPNGRTIASSTRSVSSPAERPARPPSVRASRRCSPEKTPASTAARNSADQNGRRMAQRRTRASPTRSQAKIWCPSRRVVSMGVRKASSPYPPGQRALLLPVVGGEVIDNLRHLVRLHRCAVNLDHLVDLGLPALSVEERRVHRDVVLAVTGGAATDDQVAGRARLELDPVLVGIRGG